MARLVIYFLALSAIGVAATAWIAVGNVRNVLTQSVYDRLGAVATLKEDELNRWIADQQNEIRFFAQEPEINQYLFNLALYEEDSSNYKAAYNILLSQLNAEAQSNSSFQEIFLLGPVGGKVLVSTIRQNEGQYRVSDSYYTQGRLDFYIQNVYTSPQTGKPTLTISAPVQDAQGNLTGVLAAHINLDRLDAIILQRTGLGDTGETYVVDRLNNFVSAARFGDREFPRGVHTEGIDSALKGASGKGLYVNYDGVPVVGVYRWLDTSEIAILAEVSQQEAFEPARRLAYLILATGIAVAFILAFATYLLARQIARPILAMNKVAAQVASGNLEWTVPVTTQDELGTLTQTFNLMTEQIRQSILELEQRVAERTVDLEIARQQSEKRALELGTIGEIASIITGEKKLGTLLPLITRLVSERFGFYHVGIFLVEDTDQFAILQAANSEGGQRMLARGHRLEVGGTGIVGYVAKKGEPRIALDVGSDAVFFNNPDLPTTRSEMALPLISRGRITGVLDVQSDHPGAFTETDAHTLGILADQIATAIENARLISQTEQALSEAHALYGRYVQEGWSASMEKDSAIGYRQTMTGGNLLTSAVDSDEIRQVMNRGTGAIFHADGTTEEATIVIPVKLRGQVIGVLNIKAPTKSRSWTQEEVNLAEAVSERLSLAIENARLFEETSERAKRESLVSEITTKIRGTNNPDEMLRIAAKELQRALGATRVEIIPKKSSPPLE